MLRPFSFLRFAPYGALVVLGLLLVLAAGTANPGERLEGRDKLVALIEREDERTRRLKAELDALQAQIEQLQARASTRQAGLSRVRRDIEALDAFAGLTELSGRGIRVELRDSKLRDAPTGDPNDLVIHEQDLQAVVNALWAAGAEGIAINGERIIATSAVRCVGNTLLLHGSVYAPPYIVEAVGPSQQLAAAMARDPLMERFRIYVEDFQLGFSVAEVPRLRLPAFRGIVSTRVAERLRR